MNIQLQPVRLEERAAFQAASRAAFLKGLHESFPAHENPLDIAPIPPEDDVERSLAEPGAVAYHLLLDGEAVGGTIVQINDDTQHNEVILLFTLPTAQGLGIGVHAWQAIEASYPLTKVWTLYTPYFEKRNIHFYVNKCGFHITSFHHRRYPAPGFDTDDTMRDTDYEFFRFEKVMTTS